MYWCSFVDMSFGWLVSMSLGSGSAASSLLSRSCRDCLACGSGLEIWLLFSFCCGLAVMMAVESG